MTMCEQCGNSERFAHRDGSERELERKPAAHLALRSRTVSFSSSFSWSAASWLFLGHSHRSHRVIAGCNRQLFSAEMLSNLAWQCWIQRDVHPCCCYPGCYWQIGMENNMEHISLWSHADMNCLILRLDGVIVWRGRDDASRSHVVNAMSSACGVMISLRRQDTPVISGLKYPIWSFANNSVDMTFWDLAANCWWKKSVI